MRPLTPQVIADSQPGPGGEQRPFYDFLESCLRHKAEMVIFEAARAICNLRDVSVRELTPAVTVLQLFLSSSKPVLRFAAVRTLNRVAMAHPGAVVNCNIDLETLIGDANRSIATLAITTLLKTGSEGSVDKLLKTIGGFMSDIADDFKIVVVQVGAREQVGVQRVYVGGCRAAAAHLQHISPHGQDMNNTLIGYYAKPGSSCVLASLTSPIPPPHPR